MITGLLSLAVPTVYLHTRNPSNNKITNDEIDSISDVVDEFRDIAIETFLIFGGLKFGGLLFSKIVGALARARVISLGARSAAL